MTGDMQPIEIILDWPPPGLSPNSRGHWRKGAGIKAKFKLDCARATSEQVAWDCVFAPALHMDAFYYPPDRRRYDLDNLHARMKSGLDGMCDALGIDDYRFRSKCLWRADVARTSALDGGAVRICIRGYREHAS